MKSGFIIINKPVGPTSHDIIDKLRRITGIRKIGHAGTLDPFASGVLLVAIGREATKNIGEFVGLNKEYIALLRLGATTDTYDRTGKITECEIPELSFSIESLEKELGKFEGEQKQVPPMYSAKKVKGKKLYELARKGIEIERQPVDINIFGIKLLKYYLPNLEIKIKCSSGTYIRTLAHDIGQSLGCGAYLEELKRTAVGGFTIDRAIDLDGLNSDNWTEFLFIA